MDEKKRILIIEPSTIITEGLTRILTASKLFEISTSQYDYEALDVKLATARPDILIINPTLFMSARRPFIVTMLQDYPHITVIALVYQYVEKQELRFYDGILDIREERERIVETIFDSITSHNEITPSDENTYELSNREKDVLVLMAKGLMNKEIADKLNISIHTVISHRKNITRKTNIKSVAGLAVYALMNNLIEEG
ncbi:MAG: response regulator transcription factor [Tannerella sp.]|jgi:DNA-binding NarL/FixJ family response regulator|nr:response regulator transcription factor [Tannerella sp.]